MYVHIYFITCLVCYDTESVTDTNIATWVHKAKMRLSNETCTCICIASSVYFCSQGITLCITIVCIHISMTECSSSLRCVQLWTIYRHVCMHLHIARNFFPTSFTNCDFIFYECMALCIKVTITLYTLCSLLVALPTKLINRSCFIVSS